MKYDTLIRERERWRKKNFEQQARKVNIKKGPDFDPSSKQGRKTTVLHVTRSRENRIKHSISTDPISSRTRRNCFEVLLLNWPNLIAFTCHDQKPFASGWKTGLISKLEDEYYLSRAPFKTLRR